MAAFTLVSHTQTTPSSSGGTSSPINTTGAALLVCAITVYGGAPFAPTDSQSNTWIGLTNQSSSEPEIRIFYCISPSTSASHTFTNSSSNFDTVANIAAFSATSTPTFDSQSGVNGSGVTTLQPGSLTPSQADNLVITAGGINGGGSPTVDSGFTITDAAAYSGGVNEGGSLAYLIQTAATPANPTWTWPFAWSASVAVSAAFVVAGGATNYPVTLTETSVATSDALTPATGARTATLTDTVATSEALVNLPIPVTDSVATSDSLTPATGARIATLAETSIATSDALTPATGARTATLIETSVATSDTLTGVLGTVTFQSVNVHIGLSPWVSQTYVLGSRRSNAGNAYQCVTAGLSTAAPTGNGSAINNGGAAVWKYLSSIDATSGDLRFSTTSVIPATPTLPVVVWLWNDGLITASLSAPTIWLGGHTTTSTNTITVMPAAGDGFAAAYLAAPSTALAFNAANGLAIQAPASGTGAVNYIDLDDSYVILRGLQIQDPNAGSGCSLIGGTGAHLTVQQCILDGYSQSGGANLVQLEGGHLTLTNNLIIGRNTTVSSAIVEVGTPTTSVTGAVIANNTFAHTTRITGQFALDTGDNVTAASNKAENNIFINYDVPYSAENAGTFPWTTSYNFCTAVSFSSSNDATDTGGSVYGLTAAAIFVAFPTDFNTSASAPVLNTGATDTADIPLANDIFGNTRPQGTAWDGGCVERLVAYASLLTDGVATSETLLLRAVALSLPAATAISSDALSSVAFPFSATLADTIATSEHLQSLAAGTLADTAVTSDSLTGNCTAVLLLAETAATSSIFTSSISGQIVSSLADTVITGGLFTFSAKLSLSDVAATGELLTSQRTTSPQVLADTIVTSSVVTSVGAGSGLTPWSSAFSTAFGGGVGGSGVSGNDPWSADFSAAFGAGAATGASLVQSDTLATSDAVLSSGIGVSISSTSVTSDSLTSVMRAVVSTGGIGVDPWSAAFSAAFGGSNGSNTYQDSIASSDTWLSSVGVASGSTATLGDTLTTSDSLTTRHVNGVWADTVATSESLLSSIALGGSVNTALNDSAITSDNLTTSHINGTWADSAATSETLIASVATGTTTNTTLNDSITTSDSLTTSHVNGIWTDTAATSETWIASAATGTTTNTALNDSVTTSDGFTTSHVNGTWADVAATSESLLSSIAFGGSTNTAINDGITASDSLILRAVGLFLIDVAVTNDSLASVMYATVGSGGYSFGFSTGFSRASANTYQDNAVVSETLLSTLTVAGTTITMLNDGVVTGDSVTATHVNGVWADIAATSETLIPSAAVSGNTITLLSDSATTSDSLVATQVNRSLSDTAVTSEVWTPSAAVSGNTITLLSDSAATGDGLSAIQVNGAWADAAIVSEMYLPSTAISGGIVTALNDTLTTSDNFTASQVNGVLADAAATSDTLLPNAAVSGTTATLLSDSATTSDSLLATAISGLLTDTLVTSDMLLPSTAISAGFVAALSDSVTTGDGFTTSHVNGVWADALAISETLIPSTTSIGSTTTALNDSVATSEVLAATAVNGQLADALVTSESLSGAYAIIATLTDTLATSESLLLVATVQVLADVATTSDSLSGATGYVAALSDVVVATDNAQIVILTGSFNDTLTTGETESATNSATALLADALVSSDSVTSPGLFDNITAIETLTGQTSSFQNFLDTILSGDILLYAHGFTGAWLDSAVTSDILVLQNSGYAFTQADSLVSSELWTSSGLGAPLTVVASVIPTGGAVLLEFPGYYPVLPRAVALTISRSVAGSNVWTVIYQGPPVGVFIDVGDDMPGPLDPATSYLWQAVDYSGTTIVGPLTPAASFLGTPDQLSQILIRLLQGAINGMQLPPGIQPTQVTTRMPQNGWQAMPFIVVNLDLIQQSEVAIGEDVLNPTPDNNWTLFANAKRIWRVTIMSQDVEERDFYRDSLLAVFRVLKATAFGPLGVNVTHAFQAASYASAQDYDGVAPGFYAADLMLELDGIFPVAVLTHYPVITQIVPNGSYSTDSFNITLNPLVEC